MYRARVRSILSLFVLVIFLIQINQMASISQSKHNAEQLYDL